MVYLVILIVIMGFVVYRQLYNQSILSKTIRFEFIAGNIIIGNPHV
jgi:hypothetical protein